MKSSPTLDLKYHSKSYSNLKQTRTVYADNLSEIISKMYHNYGRNSAIFLYIDIYVKMCFFFWNYTIKLQQFDIE